MTYRETIKYFIVYANFICFVCFFVYIFASNKIDMLNLQKLITDKSLDKNILSKILFPGLFRSDMALDRMIKKNIEPTAAQYRALSDLTKIPLGFLISDQWRVHADTPNKIKFLRGDVVAVLNTKNWLTVIHEYRDGKYSPVYEIQGENVPVSMYLQTLIDAVVSGNVINLKSI